MAVDGTEELVVLVEVHNKVLAGDTAGLLRRVRERVAQRVGHFPAQVITLRPGTLPRTSSGKIRRFEVAALLRSGAFAEATAPADAV
jgi:acyl-coenzyme A synthetase/AMP-(fatty) acid ligase